MSNYSILALLSFSAAALAQPTAAPTPETVGRARGEDAAGYNFVHSFETGYRFHSVDGNQDRYRSDINYGNGIRLLSSILSVNSKEGHGKLFDEIVLTTLGLGNDPYQSANLRVQHNRWYRYDMLWRSNDYVNPGLSTGASAAHALNTRRKLQDHDFILFPASRFKLISGYSRNSQNGPALSSVQLFDSRGDEFPLFANIRRLHTEYRLGGEAQLAGFRLTGLHGWQRFEEDSPTGLDAPSAGANANDLTTLRSLKRTEPYTGDSPFWRFHLSHERKSWYSANARFSYAGSRRGFTFDDTATGTDRRGNAQSRQILVSGAGRRPVSSGSFTFGLFPSNRWTITNHTAFHQIAMDGDNSYREFNNSTQGAAFASFQYLGIRTLVNATDATFKAAKSLGFYTGYHYSTRRIRSLEGQRFEGGSDQTASEQNNRVHAGLIGIRLQPSKPLTISLDGELGRADKPFYPISEKNYHGINGRVQYRARNLTLSASTKTSYNANSASLYVHSSQSRGYAFDAAWTARSWFALDAGYNKLHLNTLSGIAYFASAAFVEGDRSYYVSNIHAASLGARINIRKRADLYFGYTRVQDIGGPARAVAVLPAFRVAQSFPLCYDSPLARVSIALRSKLRWNFAYQFYHSRQDLLPEQDYRANTGFTSLLWSF